MAKGNLVNWVLGARDWRLGNKEWGMELGRAVSSSLPDLLPYDYIPPGAGLFDVTLQLET